MFSWPCRFRSQFTNYTDQYVLEILLAVKCSCRWALLSRFGSFSSSGPPPPAGFSMACVKLCCLGRGWIPGPGTRWFAECDRRDQRRRTPRRPQCHRRSQCDKATPSRVTALCSRPSQTPLHVLHEHRQTIDGRRYGADQAYAFACKGGCNIRISSFLSCCPFYRFTARCTEQRLAVPARNLIRDLGNQCTGAARLSMAAGICSLRNKDDRAAVQRPPRIVQGLYLADQWHSSIPDQRRKLLRVAKGLKTAAGSCASTRSSSCGCSASF